MHWVVFSVLSHGLHSRTFDMGLYHSSDCGCEFLFLMAHQKSLNCLAENSPLSQGSWWVDSSSLNCLIGLQLCKSKQAWTNNMIITKAIARFRISTVFNKYLYHDCIYSFHLYLMLDRKRTVLLVLIYSLIKLLWISGKDISSSFFICNAVAAECP